MKTVDELWDFYQKELLLDLKRVENYRKGLLPYVFAVNIFMALVLVGAIFFCITTMVFEIDIFVIIVIIWAGLYHLITHRYVNDFKSVIISKIVGFIDSNLSYDPMLRMPEMDFINSYLFSSNPTSFKGEDFVRGKIGETNIKFSEVVAKVRVNNSDSLIEHNRTIFKGLFFVADFNKTFNGKTLVLPDKAEAFLGPLGRTIQSMNIFRQGQLVHLEDPVFEKKFVVYGDNQITSRYILSPSLMQKIKDFSKKTGTTPYFSFVYSNIYIAIPNTSKILEPKIFSTMVSFKQVVKYFEHLSLIIGIVEELNLNTRIWGYGGEPIENN